MKLSSGHNPIGKILLKATIYEFVNPLRDTYMLSFFISLLCIIFIYFPIHANEPPSLKINILSRDLYNGAGKEIDVTIIKEGLEELGHQVQIFDYLKEPQIVKADINLFLAKFETNYFSTAKLNWLLANPDFCYASLEEIQQLDLVLCKTKECLRLFKPISKEVYYLGFTSLDCYQPGITKDFLAYLHVAGKSPMKGTEEVLQAWKTHLGLPQLIVIKHELKGEIVPENVQLITKRVPRSSLLSMQNECGVHLCPSKTEGFGHYLLEGMSTGGVVITTDAPPMNEFIKDKRCLVKYNKTDHQRYATTYIIDEKELANTVKGLQQLSHEELQTIGKSNREEYLRRKAEFKQNFEELMHQALETLQNKQCL
jgi:hypothetical protein